MDLTDNVIGISVFEITNKLLYVVDDNVNEYVSPVFVYGTFKDVSHLSTSNKFTPHLVMFASV